MKKTIGSVIKNAVLIFILLFMMYPIYMVVVNSFKTNRELYGSILGLPKKIVFMNYIDAVVQGKLLRAFANSGIITSGAVLLMTILGSFAAFAITRKYPKLNSFIYGLFIAGIIIPYQVGLIQLYRIVDRLGLVDTFTGIILIYAAWGLPFTVFVMYGFFRTIPMEVEEAAVIDGASIWRIYGHIIMPLSTSVIAAAVIYNLVWVWNDMLYPMIFIDSQKLKPLSTALLAFKGQFMSRYTVMFAGVVLASIPMVAVYVALQRQFIAGMMAGSVKG